MLLVNQIVFFSEIFLKTINNKEFKSSIILVCSKNLILKQTKFLNLKINLNEIDEKIIAYKDYKYKKVNIINITINKIYLLKNINKI